MKKRNILVIGSGGREDALARRLKMSPQAGTIYVTPGNPGTAMAGCQNISVQLTNNNLLCDLACDLEIGLAVIGSENMLATGIVPALQNRGILVFGPSHSWLIETSKSYAKLLMHSVGIPTAPFEIFYDPEPAKRYVRKTEKPVVIKADGPAFGKGVRICENVKEAESAIDDFMAKKTLGKAGKKIVIEDKLYGRELSIHALCDGNHVKLFPVVRDHKTITGKDGKELMTGGMGVCGPINVDSNIIKTIEQKIVLPCIDELRKRGSPFVGCLYPGIILTDDGPKVLEFNARFGDPEAQVYMNLLEDDVDLIEVFMACIQGRLNTIDLRWKDARCACIVLAAHGYPGEIRTGDPIIINDLGKELTKDPIVYHAGTAWSNGLLVTNGGRVLNVVTLIGHNPVDIYFEAYRSVLTNKISFSGMQVRYDIVRSFA